MTSQPSSSKYQYYSDKPLPRESVNCSHDLRDKEIGKCYFCGLIPRIDLRGRCTKCKILACNLCAIDRLNTEVVNEKEVTPLDTKEKILPRSKIKPITKCRCYACGKIGHYARQCKSSIGRAAVLRNLKDELKAAKLEINQLKEKIKSLEEKLDSVEKRNQELELEKFLEESRKELEEFDKRKELSTQNDLTIIKKW